MKTILDVLMVIITILLLMFSVGSYQIINEQKAQIEVLKSNPKIEYRTVTNVVYYPSPTPKN